jgi:hypothetical protein
MVTINHNKKSRLNKNDERLRSEIKEEIIKCMFII